MTITTSLTKRFGIKHPIVLAPMTPAFGGVLASAVAAAGGLGLIGGGYVDRVWFEQESAKVGQLDRTTKLTSPQGEKRDPKLKPQASGRIYCNQNERCRSVRKGHTVRTRPRSLTGALAFRSIQGLRSKSKRNEALQPAILYNI